MNDAKFQFAWCAHRLVLLQMGFKLGQIIGVNNAGKAA